MKTAIFTLISVILLVGGICNPNAHSETFTYHWEIDETPEGSESATIIEPVEVKILDLENPIQVASHSPSLKLMKKYSVHLVGDRWTPGHAAKLLQTFESIPQETNNLYDADPMVPPSMWILGTHHIQNDIHILSDIVLVSAEAFTYAEPRLAEIEGVRGKFFSKRLHRAVVRFVTDNGADRYALERILRERYDVSVNVPDYTELTRYTTGEHAGRFSTFKNEELLALVSMLEEFPSGMIKTPGLKYMVRRLDGTPHPLYPGAPAVAWPSAGYIEFMESAFKGQGPDYIHRLILHEKAHFLWEYLFDNQLKQDWIELGGWYENPDDVDGWSTTKQVEFVSAYAHGKNPNEDMAESISYYIVNPDKLRSRSPAKYEFIQNRVMHGTRYISQIREDLTFEVYNLYPDYVYPGRIIRIDIEVTGKPEEDKNIMVEMEIHETNEYDSAGFSYVRVLSNKGTYFDIRLNPVGPDGQIIDWGHTFRGYATLSRYAANGYWSPDQITLKDAVSNQRHKSQTDFGWKLYINNSLSDCEPPRYVENSAQLSFGPPGNENGRPYQVIIARWKIIEENEVRGVSAWMNDQNPRTYSHLPDGRALNAYDHKYNPSTHEAIVELIVPDYLQSGTYALSYISMGDVAGNYGGVFFTSIGWGEKSTDEAPATIEIQTTRPDDVPPVLDLNNITIKAEPTNPEAPNGETKVDITFRIKDNISGYQSAAIRLRDPQGIMHRSLHGVDGYKIYFRGDPTVYKTYHHSTVLPVGSAPGTWGLAEMNVMDKAQNILRADFTEIVRFEVEEGAAAAPVIVILPDQTELLPNYPNPFNPETWIPYQLATDSNVQITIYDTKGIVVRTLALGHQSAGYYTGRSRAAYWDGRNGLGERVASGLYFYQLWTDEISPMRKMVILK